MHLKSMYDIVWRMGMRVIWLSQFYAMQCAKTAQRSCCEYVVLWIFIMYSIYNVSTDIEMLPFWIATIKYDMKNDPSWFQSIMIQCLHFKKHLHRMVLQNIYILNWAYMMYVSCTAIISMINFFQKVWFYINKWSALNN